jgi:ankyrin repeat protein
MLNVPQRTAAAGSEETAELPSEPARRRSIWRNPRMKILLLVLAVVIGIGVYYHIGNPVNQLNQKGIPFTEQAFFQAVRTDNQELVKLFLDAGYKPDHAAQDTGETAVMAAIEAGQFPMVNYLIAQGASLDRKDYQGRKPMDIALKNGNIQILKLLMDQQKRGPDSKDEQGRTLLEQAILAGNMTSVKYVIEQGAAINTVDIHGNTLLDQMLAAGNQPVALLLKSLGAKRNVNKDFVRGQLNEIKVPPGDTTGFEIDLLGNGLGQQITLARQNSSRGTVVISQDGRLLAEYSNFRSQRWYAAYLRDDNTPDLIYFRLVGADFIEEIKIIGRTGKETIGILFAPDLGMLRSMGLLHGQAGIQFEGKQLIVYSGKNRAAVEWSPEQQSFRMRKL